MHLSAAIPGGGEGGGGGAYAGMGRDLLTLVANFKPGKGNWVAFALSWQDTRGKTRGICNAATILKMDLETSESVPFPSAKGLGMFVNTFQHVYLF